MDFKSARPRLSQRHRLMADSCGMAPPKDAHNSVPRTCDQVTLYGKRDLAGEIKIRTLRGEITLDYLDVPTNHRVLSRRRQG